MTAAKKLSALPAGGDLELRSVTKFYGDVEVVRPTSLTIASGDFVTLLGPSGSGKTTLLKMVAGFEAPSTGLVFIGGKDVTKIPPQKRNVGFVFQQYALFPHLTVAGNLAYPLQMRRMGRREIDHAVGQALELVRLSHLANRRPSDLSGGQQQRVALARAVIFRPPILLMDESLAALDKRLREEMQIEIRNLQRELNITTIAVTHDQTEALVMSDVVYVINDGSVQQAGTPDQLYYQPNNEFVAGFLGESNVLRGRLDRSPGSRGDLILDSGLKVPFDIAQTNASDGSKVVCMIRPEVIDLIPVTPAAASALDGTVLERIFCGDSFRVTVKLADGTRLLCKPTASRTRWLPNVGEATRLSWQTSDLTVIS